MQRPESLLSRTHSDQCSFSKPYMHLYRCDKREHSENMSSRELIDRTLWSSKIAKPHRTSKLISMRRRPQARRPKTASRSSTTTPSGLLFYDTADLDPATMYAQTQLATSRDLHIGWFPSTSREYGRNAKLPQQKPTSQRLSPKNQCPVPRAARSPFAVAQHCIAGTLWSRFGPAQWWPRAWPRLLCMQLAAKCGESVQIQTSLGHGS